MKKIIVGIFMLSFTLNANAGDVQSIAKFASPDKARQLLLTEDLFTKSWSQFDIDARLQKNNSTKQELFTFITEQVREWTEEEKEKLNKIFREIDQSVADQKFKLNFPEEIYFVKTTALEEGGAGGYTRGNYIVLKSDIMALPENSVKQTVIHELFHILTRYDNEFRRDMYAIIGFKLMKPIKYPEAIAHRRITNPDAPQTDSYVTLRKDGSANYMMILYSDGAYGGGLFFQYLNVGFLQLDAKKQPVVDKGFPVIHSMNEVEGFFEQIGRNTQYILHPEEIMADNFVFAINDRKGQPTQKIVQEIQKRLRKR
ncbi:MAG: hypothetical protein ITG00_00250 [Flavobacterium sp.]|nr:hypothetical protein [Flavobacterium sp.]